MQGLVEWLACKRSLHLILPGRQIIPSKCNPQHVFSLGHCPAPGWIFLVVDGCLEIGRGQRGLKVQG